jgi:hypothetical protein
MNTSNISTGSNTSISSTQDNQNLRTAMITLPPWWPFLHVLSLHTISYRSGSSISDVGIDLSRCIAWTKIQLKGCKALYTGCFYRKPDNEPSALENLNNSLSRLTHNSTLPNVILSFDGHSFHP